MLKIIWLAFGLAHPALDFNLIQEFFDPSESHSSFFCKGIIMISAAILKYFYFVLNNAYKVLLSTVPGTRA